MNRNENKTMPGDVLSVNRGIYKNYDVYIGNNTMVHFSTGEGFELLRSELASERQRLKTSARMMKFRVLTLFWGYFFLFIKVPVFFFFI